MFGKDRISAAIGTVYICIFCALFFFPGTENWAILMVIFFPFLMIWIIYLILKNGKYEGPELGDNEFGYQDRKEEDLGIF